MPFVLGLVDYLTWKMGYAYSSDLRYTKEKGKLFFIVEHIPLEQCTVREWQEAVRYLTGERDCENAEQAKNALMAWANSLKS